MCLPIIPEIIVSDSSEPPRKKMKLTSNNINHLSMSSGNLECEAEAFFDSSLVLPSDWANNKTGSTGCNSTSPSTSASTDIATEPFGDYFKRWLIDEERNLVDLRVATTESSSSVVTTDSSSVVTVESMVGRVMRHYEDYYKVKSESDGVYMLNAPWLSPLEHTFEWIGGWRATTAFHLLYTVVGLQLEAQLSYSLHLGSLRDNISIGVDDDNLMTAMTSTQLVLVDKLQLQTIRQERELTEALACSQETVADSTMVQLSHLATVSKDKGVHSSSVKIDEQVKSNLRAKEDKLKELISKADDLRLKMFKNVVHILNPLQAAHFLIAAAELHLRLHEWGQHNYNHAAVGDLLIKITPLLLIND